jgi:hypothetical protein
MIKSGLARSRQSTLWCAGGLPTSTRIWRGKHEYRRVFAASESIGRIPYRRVSEQDDARAGSPERHLLEMQLHGQVSAA